MIQVQELRKAIVRVANCYMFICYVNEKITSWNKQTKQNTSVLDTAVPLYGSSPDADIWSTNQIQVQINR